MLENDAVVSQIVSEWIERDHLLAHPAISPSGVELAMVLKGCNVSEDLLEQVRKFPAI